MTSSSKRRLLILLGFGSSLILLVLAYGYFVLARPVGSGPAGPAVAAKPFDRVWSERRVKLLGIGDSVTAGLGARSLDHSYFNRLIKNPDDEYADMQGKCLSLVLPNLESENLAISGTTSDAHLDVITNSIPVHDIEVFGLIVMTSGGNDLIHSYGRSPPRECGMYGATFEQAQPWIDAYRLRLREMFQRLQAAFPGGCEIFIADIYDPTDGVGDAPSIYLPPWKDGLAIHAAYNAVIAECAAEHSNVHVVPMYRTFLGHGSHCRQFWRANYRADDPTHWYYENIEDPNDRGYDAIRRIFLNTILEHSQLLLVH